MAVTYTPDQQKVIDLRNCNILVSAAAGSGKTAVLTERIVQRICDEEDPVQIDRMLIVTFTKAAAAEMRERIGDALRNRLALEPKNAHLRKQITLLNGALITTIDSFCLYLIRNHFHEIQLDPGFRIADEGEIKLLKDEVLEAFLEEQYEIGEPQFTDLVEKYAGAGDTAALADLILKIYEFVQSHPFPEEYLRECMKELQTEKTELSEACNTFLRKQERIILEECINVTQKAIALCHEPGGPVFYEEALQDDLAFYHQAMGAELTFAQRTDLYSGHKFKTLSTKKQPDADLELKEEVKDLRNGCKKIVQEFQSKFFYAAANVLLEENYEAGKTLQVLLENVVLFMHAFEQEKRKKNIIDFSDMEHLALKILLHYDGKNYVPGEVALGYQEYFQEVMVDEYQDSNLVQELLLESVSKQSEDSGNRFMVGDVKQSIYRFRLARPEIFMDKYNSYNVECGKDRRINLSCNFRSCKQVIDSVNTVFEQIMIPQIGNIIYDDAAKLYYGADYKDTGEENKSEILLYDKAEFEQQHLSQTEAEAHIIAERIRRLLGEFQVKDKKSGQLRPVKLSDMVILLRTASGVDDILKKTLESEGIPAYISSGKGYFAAPEIRVILNYIAILNNPRQDIPLLGVMHSVLGKFTEEEIAKIRLCNQKKGRLYDSLTKYADSGSEEGLKNHCAAFVEELTMWRKKAAFITVYELLEQIYEKSGYMQYCMALPGGVQRRANLLVLLQKAKAFESGAYSGLFDFIRYIERMKEREIDFGEANVLDENAEVVRIMTIHKSKGLEFPVCFVAGFSKQFNIKESSAPVLTDADLGPGNDYIDLELRCKRKSIRKNIIAAKQKNDSRGEDLRILYVALTRAKEKLIMVGHGQRPEADTCEMNAYRLLKAKSFMDMVLPIAAEHREQFEIHEYSYEQIPLNQVTEQIEAGVLRQGLQTMEGAAVWQSYQYPHTSMEGLYTKTTVSELKKSAYLEEEEHCAQLYAQEETSPYIPKFIEAKEEEGGGSRRGSAYHRVMELIDFSIAMEQENRAELLRAGRQKAVDELRIPKEEDALVREGKILAFLDTELAKRMAIAEMHNCLRKEQPFVIGVAANLVKPEFPETEEILVQGVIDVYFEEDGELVLLDYKTDRVSAEGELVKRYRTQLDYYAEALERLTHKKVKERLIYSFALEKIIEV